MDAVPNIRNLAESRPDLDAELGVVRDPFYNVFMETKKYKGDALELQVNM